MKNQNLKTIDKIRICLQGLTMENSLLQSYRLLFMAIEAALFALGFVLLQIYQGKGLWWIAIFGWLVAILWGIMCYFKAKDIDRWRNRLLKVVGKVGLSEWFEYLKPGFKFAGGRIIRWVFNYLMPLLVIGLWVFLLKLI